MRRITKKLLSVTLAAAMTLSLTELAPAMSRSGNDAKQSPRKAAAATVTPFPSASPSASASARPSSTPWTMPTASPTQTPTRAPMSTLPPNLPSSNDLSAGSNEKVALSTDISTIYVDKSTGATTSTTIGTVTNVAQTPASGGYATVSWSPAMGASGYEIYTSSAKVGQQTSDYVTATSTTEAKIPVMQEASLTIYIVGISSSNGTKNYSTQAVRTTVYGELGPTVLTITGGSETLLSFQTQSLNNSGSYEYVMKNNKGKVINKEDTSISIHNMTPLKGNMCTVQARRFIQATPNSRITGPWSNVILYGFPGKVSCSKRVTHGRLKLKWSKVKGAKKYIVYISKQEKSGYKKIKTLKAKKHSTWFRYGKKNLKPGNVYYIRICTKGSSHGKKGMSAVNFSHRLSVFRTFRF